MIQEGELSFQEKLDLFGKERQSINVKLPRSRLTTVTLNQSAINKRISLLFSEQAKINNNRLEQQNLLKKLEDNVLTNNIIIEEEDTSQKQDYDSRIKSSPEKLFSIITHEKISLWKNSLYKYISNTPVNDDSDILNTESNTVNQRVIKNDVLRTRVRESILINSFKDYLEFFLTYYCKHNDVKYKQGLNEIVGPMLLLKYKIQISLSEIFNLIQGFVNKYLTNYYREEKLFALQSACSLVTLLLKYHLPTVHNILDKCMITPQMYATNWILTLFGGKFQIDILYHLWDYLIEYDDSMFIFYMIVALLDTEKDKILNSDITYIPSIITKLSIESVSQLKTVVDLALEIRKNTPYSFRILANQLKIFQPNVSVQELEKCYNFYKPDSLTAMPMYPSEIFYITYHDSVNCPDDQCENANDNSNIFDVLDKNDPYFTCEHCDMKIKKDINYILFDLRILEYGAFETSDEKTGFLPMMIMVEQEELKSENFTDSIMDRFIDDKGNYHFVFMTSKTDYFKQFEDNYYQDDDKRNDPYQMMLVQSQIKVDKKLNERLINKMSLKDKYKLIEYDNLKKLLKKLLDNNFPYVSFITGGFSSVHENSFKYEISLLNHDPKCDLCKEMNKQNKHKVLKNFQKKKVKEPKIKVAIEKNILPSQIVTPNVKGKSRLSQKIEKTFTPNQGKSIFDDFENSDEDDNLDADKYREQREHNRQTINKLNDNIQLMKVTEMILDSEFTVNMCILKEHKSKIFTPKQGNQIMFIMDHEFLNVFKVEKGSSIDDNQHLIKSSTIKDESINHESELARLDKIKIQDIIKVETQQNNKNVVNIQYYENKENFFTKKVSQSTQVMIVDFINSRDARKFILSINQLNKIIDENPIE